ncbi:MAG: histidine kinase [Okeania sp. SIO3I5]|uniref:ATP-binding protein n=1 Tax=Okeania sp. SIO3I5 TaxID=2607805 RepID=UPI0013BC0E48|nr:ATP-binding protein [Okeania sp. SIO3I5]NEQ37390.1 histidine kinase [Okeania sp. SIO3I5]
MTNTDPKIVKERRDYNSWVATETLEDYSLRYAPKSFRKWSEFLVANTAIGGISFLALEAIGGSLVINYGFTNSFWAIIVVSLIIFLAGFPIAYYASKYNIDIDLLTRGAGFGYIGSTITSLIYASFTFIFFAIEAAIMAQALELYFHIPLAWGYLISSIIIIPIVFYGVTLINKLQLWTQPIWLFLMVSPYLFVLHKEPEALNYWFNFTGNSPTGTQFDPILFGMAAKVSFSLIAQLGEQVDYLRFLPPKNQNNSRKWWIAMLVAGPGWVILGGAKQLGGAFLATLAIAHGNTIAQAKEPIQMYLAGFADMFSQPEVVLFVATLFVIISQIKINVTNAYAGSLAWSNFFSRLTHSHPGRVVWLIFNVAIALLLMELGIFETLESILGLYSNVAIAWIGAIVADLVVNKPLKLSPSYIEFKRAYLYNINPVGFGAMAIASVVAIMAFVGFFGPLLQAYSPFIALTVAFCLSPIIALVTKGKYYIARQNTVRTLNLSDSLLTCSICTESYEAQDMAFCPVYDGYICSLCCSLDARCDDQCKKETPEIAEEKSSFSQKLIRSKISPLLGQRIIKFLGIFLSIAGILAAFLGLLYYLQIEQSSEISSYTKQVVASVIEVVFFSLLLPIAIGISWFILSEESRERAEAELDKQNIQLQQEIAERKRAEIALQELAQELEIRVEQRTAELSEALQNLRQAQTQLIKEKLSSLSQLVAGIAHEINNPVSFIHGNLQYAKTYIEDLLTFIDTYQQEIPETPPMVAELFDEIDVDFIRADYPKLLESMRVGTDRITQIVLSLRVFSRLDESDIKEVDLHQGLDSTLVILGSRLKANSERSEIEILKLYGDLPLVECYAVEINQVFLNLLINAIDALDDFCRNCKSTNYSPKITIKTCLLDSKWVRIEIADNGSGIPEHIQPKLFDAFFTTKDVGKGMGLGLSISYQIVVENHGGKLYFLNVEQGAAFVMEIPVRS